MDLTQLLQLAAARGASDLHLSAGLPPRLRQDGELAAIDHAPLQDGDLRAAAETLMPAPLRALWQRGEDVDFASEVPGVGRVRVNAFRQLRGTALVMRLLPRRIPDLDTLRLPPVVSELLELPRGLLLVTGPTGSGKSTTLAAMVQRLNQTQALHILTIEDPIEFVHEPARSLISQRELHRHTQSFASALRSGLREDPDVMLVGELRDLETIRLALTAAETGHLVLASLHTASAPKTIDRIIDVFPAGEKESVRAMLAESLRAVIAQTLLPAAGGGGRVAAFELMLGTPAIRNLIRENKVAQMVSVLQTGQREGMQTLDQALAVLVRAGLVDAAAARRKASDPKSLVLA
ncbi:twitching motility protein PilT [Solimonas aquatica]|uniref:Twitching motility protein PilT n=1 Tax=Solimonas aquatica TaxID=489703 RepID=A0A1H9D303_9GAMM|nr:type IV pilus twitching motility protein PilT [Solimonas aquatica]SEQ07178.1 twitching motility protein PilT [Solimonas aquatica]